MINLYQVICVSARCDVMLIEIEAVAWSTTPLELPVLPPPKTTYCCRFRWRDPHAPLYQAIGGSASRDVMLVEIEAVAWSTTLLEPPVLPPPKTTRFCRFRWRAGPSCSLFTKPPVSVPGAIFC